MKKLFNYLKNDFLYSFLKILALTLLGIVLGNSGKVHAATYEYKIFGGVNDSEFSIAANGSRISTADKFMFYGNTMNNYMYIDVCTTGYKPSVWVYDIKDGDVSISTQVLKVNKNCYTSGYKADVYRFTFFVSRAEDIGQDMLGLNFTTRLFSETDYTAYMRILSVFGSDTLSYADIEAGQSEALQKQQEEANNKLNDINNSIKNQIEQQKKTNEELKKTNDTLTDDDVSDSTNKANEFFSGFTTDTFGLTSIITAPLTLIGSITSSTCSPLGLKVPFVENKTLNLPCMSSIYQQHFGSFLTIYQTITFGIIAYWVCVRIFALVKDFKNPDTDKVEVLDL